MVGNPDRQLQEDRIPDRQGGGPAGEGVTLRRGLAAILSADVSGYSRLMREDEEATVGMLAACRELIARQVAAHGGRVADTAGDSALATFSSVVEALRCAVEIQRELGERNAALPNDRRMEFRLGVHLGDILSGEDAVYGDGVNVAARLEALADPGGICISGDVYSQVRHRLALDYDFLGRRRVKNIPEPIPVYRVSHGAPRHRRPGWARLGRHAAVVAVIITGLMGLALVIGLLRPPAALRESGLEPVAAPAGPSIVVLPFRNLSPEPEQDYFSDGITADLTAELSNLSGLLVIARTTAFAYRTADVSPREIGRELGVRYLLQGTVRRAGRQLRITAELVETESGRQIWGGRYDGTLEDVFALQDAVTERIVGALQVTVTEAEQARLARRYTVHLEAYDHFLQGQWHFQEFTAEGNARARAHYERALELDPGFARALAALALTHAWDSRWGWSADRSASLSMARELADRALVLDDSLPQVRWVQGYVLLHVGEFEQALAQARYATALDPNFAEGYGLVALILVAMGEPQQALEHMERAVRLNPHYSALYATVIGSAYILLERYDDAVRELTKAVAQHHTHLKNHVLLAAAYGRQGRLDEAAWVAEEIRMLSPGFSIGYWVTSEASPSPETLQWFIDGLRKAGIPE
jgi:adenylate cyclase